jgi:hypothetical protein
MVERKPISLIKKDLENRVLLEKEKENDMENK